MRALKSKKTVYVCLLAMLLSLLTVFPTATAFADEVNEVTASVTEVRAGETFDLAVTFTTNGLPDNEKVEVIMPPNFVVDDISNVQLQDTEGNTKDVIKVYKSGTKIVLETYALEAGTYKVVGIKATAPTVSTETRGTAYNLIVDTSMETPSSPVEILVNPEAPSKLAIKALDGSQLASELVAGDSINFMVQATDKYGNLSLSENDVALTLTQSPEATEVDKTVYEGDALVIPAGEHNSQAITFTAQKAQDYTITIADNDGNLAAVSHKFSVKPADALPLIMTIGNNAETRTVDAGVYTEIDLGLKDMFGNAAPVADDVTVNLSTDIEGAKILDAPNGTEVTSVKIVKNASIAKFYVWTNDYPQVNRTITATIGETPYKLDGINVVGPNANKFELTGNEAVEVNLRNKIDIQLKDQYGNPFNAPVDMFVELNVKNKDGFYVFPEFYNALIGGWQVNMIKIAKGSNTATVYFRSSEVGEFTIEARAFMDKEIIGTKKVTVFEAKLIRTNISEDSTNEITAGTRGKLIVNQTDMYGNVIVPTSDVVVNLTSTSPTGKFFATADDTTPITSVKIEAGKAFAEVYYYDETAAWDTMISASIPGLEADDFFMLVEPDVPADIQMNVIETPIVNDYGTLQIRVVDKFGNNAYDGTPFTVDLSSTGNCKFYDGIWDEEEGWDWREVSQATVYDSWKMLAFKNDTVGEFQITATSTGISKTITVNVEEKPVFEHQDRVLTGGWNTLSVPVALKDQTFNALFGDAAGNVEAVFAYNNDTGAFEKITDFDTELQLLDAVFVKVAEGQTVPIKFCDKITSAITAPPSKHLNPGWNFVGPAVWDSAPWLDANTNFESVEGKYAQVISPGYNQEAWIYTSDMGQYNAYVQAGYGYWIFMKDDGTLAGFSYTPTSYTHGDRDVVVE